MIYAMEQLQGGEWKPVGYGEFESFDEARRDTEILVSKFGLTMDDVRIRAVSEIPYDELQPCGDCGHPLSFTQDHSKAYCHSCEEFKERNKK